MLSSQHLQLTQIFFCDIFISHVRIPRNKEEGYRVCTVICRSEAVWTFLCRNWQLLVMISLGWCLAVFLHLTLIYFVLSTFPPQHIRFLLNCCCFLFCFTTLKPAPCTRWKSSWNQKRSFFPYSYNICFSRSLFRCLCEQGTVSKKREKQKCKI